MSSIQAALFGIRESLDLLRRTAERVSNVTADADPARTAVDLMTARSGVRAGVAVARTADEAIGSLLDVVR